MRGSSCQRIIMLRYTIPAFVENMRQTSNVTPSLHHEKYVLASSTLRKSYGITYQQKVPGPPNPWNKYCA